MIDIQQAALGTLEEHFLAGFHRVEQIGRGVGHVWFQPPGISVVLLKDIIGVEAHVVLSRAQPGQDLPFGPANPLDPPAEVLAIHVAEADGERTADLIAVAGPDASQRGADRLAAGTLAVDQPILFEVPGQDDVRPVAEHQVFGDLDAPGAEGVDFLEDAGRIEHHSAGYHTLHVGSEDAAGYQRQLVGLAAGDHGMARVGPALIADHDVVLLGQQIDDLPFGLVAPLQSDHTSCRHCIAPRINCMKTVPGHFPDFPNIGVYQSRSGVVKGPP